MTIAFNDRLQEKMSNMESENQILRQQSLMHSPVKRMSEHLSIPTTPTKQAVIVLQQGTVFSVGYFALFLKSFLSLMAEFGEWSP